jgi:acetolactate synthase-1/2/3 large subunit
MDSWNATKCGKCGNPRVDGKRRPVILLGNGARKNPKLIEYIANAGIPVLTTWAGIDLIPDDSPVFCGRPGILGNRAANIIQQKADVLYCIGARLDPGQTAFDLKGFAPGAIKVVYDCDQDELDKLPQGWTKINADLALWDIRLDVNPNPGWLTWCKNLYERFAIETAGNSRVDKLTPFELIGALSDVPCNGLIWALGSSGTVVEAFMQAFKVRTGDRIINASNIGAMGADIPMAIGACIGSGRKPVVCVTGDGSFMLNIQELEVAKRENLPIAFIVANNGGYASIRQMQTVRFGGHKVGSDVASGLTLPRISDLSRAFDITYACLSKYPDLEMLDNLLAYPCPIIVEVMIDPDWVQQPKVRSSFRDGVLVPDPMEDMTPHIADLKELMEWGGE